MYEYKFCQSLDSKLHVHDHVTYVFPQYIQLLGLVRSLSFSFPNL
jgi:hypothetical protein